jgi:hypothetical protein
MLAAILIYSSALVNITMDDRPLFMPEFQAVEVSVTATRDDGTKTFGRAQVDGCEKGKGHIYIMNNGNKRVEIDYDWKVGGPLVADKIAEGVCKQYLGYIGGDL